MFSKLIKLIIFFITKKVKIYKTVNAMLNYSKYDRRFLIFIQININFD